MFTKILVALDIHQLEIAARVLETVGTYFSSSKTEIHFVTAVSEEKYIDERSRISTSIKR